MAVNSVTSPPLRTTYQNVHGTTPDHVARRQEKGQSYENVIANSAGQNSLIRNTISSIPSGQQTNSISSTNSVVGNDVHLYENEDGGRPDSRAASRRYTGTGNVRDSSNRFHFESITDGDSVIPVRLRGWLPVGWVPGKNDGEFGISFKEHSNYKPETAYAFYVMLDGSKAKRKKFSNGKCGCILQ